MILLKIKYCIKNQEIVFPTEKYIISMAIGENRSLPISEVFKDPDLFGGEEDRIPWVEKAFENAESQ
ncbi:MAG: hypothetical protein CM15mP4_3790 [Candidatus Neomarinimicrobiota bacterium]|nr:MAG: hypothetical protein CM15mP4_3790 [Candidatus Neomarinimicrobiota bacterium]